MAEFIASSAATLMAALLMATAFAALRDRQAAMQKVPVRTKRGRSTH